jgi:hypothetical protein
VDVPEADDRALKRDSDVARWLIKFYRRDYVVALYVLGAGRLTVGLVAFYFIWRSRAISDPVAIVIWMTILCVYSCSLYFEVFTAIRQMHRVECSKDSGPRYES